MGTKRRAHLPKNERHIVSDPKPRPDAGLFFCRLLRTSPGGHLAWRAVAFSAGGDGGRRPPKLRHNAGDYELIRPNFCRQSGAKSASDGVGE